MIFTSTSRLIVDYFLLVDYFISRLLVVYRLVDGSLTNKKLSYRRVTARCVLSVVILPITTQQCRNYLYDKS